MGSGAWALAWVDTVMEFEPGEAPRLPADLPVSSEEVEGEGTPEVRVS